MTEKVRLNAISQGWAIHVCIYVYKKHNIYVACLHNKYIAYNKLNPSKTRIQKIRCPLVDIRHLTGSSQRYISVSMYMDPLVFNGTDLSVWGYMFLSFI